MIDIESRLTGDLDGALDRFAKEVQDRIIVSGVAAAAKVVYETVRQAAPVYKGHGGMPFKRVSGVMTTPGQLRDAVYRVYSPERSNDGLKTYRVSVNKAKAPHWYLIEYGHWQTTTLYRKADGSVGVRKLDPPKWVPAHPYIRKGWDVVPYALEMGKRRMAERLQENASGAGI